MTPRQQEALEAVRRFVSERSRAPSVGEIAIELGVSRERARQLVEVLESKGTVMRGVVPLHNTSGDAA